MQLYRYETHTHTNETSSCGKVDACDLVQYYKESGYQGVVITDHYYKDFFEKLGDISWEDKMDAYLKGYRAALEKGGEIGLRVILGMELRFQNSPNDYLVYGFDEEFLLRNEKLYEMTLKEFRELATQNGLLIYQAHPFRNGAMVGKGNYLDGIEVFNGNPRHWSNNIFACLFAREHQLKMLSGSDYHQPQDLARGGIEVERDLRTSEELVEYLKECSEVRLITTGSAI